MKNMFIFLSHNWIILPEVSFSHFPLSYIWKYMVNIFIVLKSFKDVIIWFICMIVHVPGHEYTFCFGIFST